MVIRYLFDVLDSIKKEIKGRHLYLFLDYDGTLTPIVDRPDSARLSADAKKILKDFLKNPLFRTFIITGRSLEDIRQIIGIKSMCYIGNHGFEMDIPGIEFKKFDICRTREIIDYLKWQINKEIIFFKGAFIEDKGINLCIHYRMLKENQIDIFNTVLKELTIPFFVKKEIRLELDRKTFEIRPPIDWDKGKAILWLLNELKKKGEPEGVPFYIGDSLTDENAFKVLKNGGVTIRVGKSQQSSAQYYVKGQEEVLPLLKELLCI